jgi:flagellar biosynthesis/type III secretory pathway protein FliH
MDRHDFGMTVVRPEEYRILVARNRREATPMWMTWSERLKAEGKREGLKLGKQEGRQEGVRSLQQVLVRILEQRFGPLPERVHNQVEAIDSLRRLTRLLERVLTVGSLRELRLR